MDDSPFDKHARARSEARLVASAHVKFESGTSKKLAIHGNYFKSAEWSPDGTCIITNSADNHIRTFIVPPDLLEIREKPLGLAPYSTVSSFEAVDALVCYPGFRLDDPSTALVLSAASEHPIRLNSAVDAQLIASYPLINMNTEAYIKPHAILFFQDGASFAAASTNLISFFDVSRAGQVPISSIITGPRHNGSKLPYPSNAVKGIVSALGLDAQYNVLAAGTLSRQVGLYDSAGSGDCIGAFSVAETEADASIKGAGVTQLRWSRCGRYLYVAERQSDGCLIYDVRKTGQLLSWTVGRKAMTNQRMGMDLAYDREESISHLWAGGTDGVMRRWSEPHSKEGVIEPDWQQHAHTDSLNSIGMHATASVIATAGGHRALDASRSPDGLEAGVDHGANLLKLFNLRIPP